MSGAPETAASAQIRPFRDSDGLAAAELFRELLPEFMLTAELLVHWIRTLPERAHGRHWVAEDAGRLVGYAEGEVSWTKVEPGICGIWVAITEDARGRGLGSRMFDLAESHLLEHGARVLRSSTRSGDERSIRFLEARGFRHTRTTRTWTLDPRDVDLAALVELEAAKQAEGLRVAPLGDVRDRPRDLHAVYEEAHADIPSDHEAGPLPYDEWFSETLDNPLLDDEASRVVLDGDRPGAGAVGGGGPGGGPGGHPRYGAPRAGRRRGGGAAAITR